MATDPRSADHLDDHIAEASSCALTTNVITKSGLSPQVFVFIGLALVATIGCLQLIGQRATQQIALQLPTTTVPITVAPAPAPSATEINDEERVPLPDRGGMRLMVQGWLENRCADIISGPEPLLTHVYEQHLACIEDEMVKLEETCYLTAQHYYQYPGEEAIEVACAEPLGDGL